MRIVFVSMPSSVSTSTRFIFITIIGRDRGDDQSKVNLVHFPTLGLTRQCQLPLVQMMRRWTGNINLKRKNRYKRKTNRYVRPKQVDQLYWCRAVFIQGSQVITGIFKRKMIESGGTGRQWSDSVSQPILKLHSFFGD
jgi:hypothetical protein